MVYEDAHSLHLVGDLLHLDKDLLERWTHTNQMDNGSAKALPLCLDIVVVSLSGHGGEYHLGHWWICVGR